MVKAASKSGWEFGDQSRRHPWVDTYRTLLVSPPDEMRTVLTRPSRAACLPLRTAFCVLLLVCFVVQQILEKHVHGPVHLHAAEDAVDRHGE